MSILVVDLETTGLNPHTDRIVGAGLNGLWETNPDWIRALVQGKGLTCHNGNFDIKFLWALGAKEAYVEFDTMIAAYLLPNRPESLSLGSCAKFYLGVDDSWKQTFTGNALDMDRQVLKEYCLKDVEVTTQLRQYLEKALIENGLMPVFERLMKARNLLSQAEFKGITVDWNALETLLEQLKSESEAIKKVLTIEEGALIKEWQDEQIKEKLSKLKRPERAKVSPPDFNWSSPKQILWALKKIGADVNRYDFKEKGFKESSSSEVLENNEQKGRFIKPLLKLRSAEKTLGMLEGYLEAKNTKTGNLHGQFNLTVTSTGRLSSSNPNLQNIDSGPTIRSLFIPSPGKTLVIADLAQIEVRMAAHYSQDPVLINMFKEGLDFYGTIAKEVLQTPCHPNEVKEKFPEDRKVAKVIGLSILYGTGARRLQSAIKSGAGRDYSEEECREIISNYFKKFAGLKILQKRVEKAILEKGHLVNLFGRKLYIAPEDIYMNGVNYLLQSSASDLMLFRQLEMDNTRSTLIALVHDEVLRECKPEDVEFVKTDMERALQRIDDINFRVPLKTEAKVCKNWSEGK